MVGGGGPVLECGDIKIGRQIQGQVMPTLPKNEMKSASHLPSQLTLYSDKSSDLI